MSFWRPIQWYHSHADPIWPDSTFHELPDTEHGVNVLVRVISWGGAAAPLILLILAVHQVGPTPSGPAYGNIKGTVAWDGFFDHSIVSKI